MEAVYFANPLYTLQPEAKNMEPAYLKDRFGEKLSFHGCISTAGPVVDAPVDEVVQDVINKLIS